MDFENQDFNRTKEKNKRTSVFNCRMKPDVKATLDELVKLQLKEEADSYHVYSSADFIEDCIMVITPKFKELLKKETIEGKINNWEVRERTSLRQFLEQAFNPI